MTRAKTRSTPSSETGKYFLFALLASWREKISRSASVKHFKRKKLKSVHRDGHVARHGGHGSDDARKISTACGGHGRREVWKFRASQRGGSGSTPENLLSISMTSASRSVSLMTFINSSGINGETSSVTSFLNSARNSGSLNTLRIASCRISTRSFGVPGGKTKCEAGVLKPRHIAKSFFSFSVLAKLSISGSWAKRGCGCLSPSALPRSREIHYSLFHPFRIAP